MSDSEPEPSEVREPGIKLDKRSASRALGWSMIYAVISKLVFPLAGIYVNRKLGPTQLGTFALIQTIVSFSEVIRDAGLTQTFMAEPHMDRRKEGSYFMVSIVTALIPAVILLALAPILAGFFQLPDLTWALPLVTFVILVNGFSTIPRAKMLKEGQIKLQGFIELVGGAIGLTMVIIMVYFGVGYVALICQMLFASVYTSVANWLRYPVRSINIAVQAFRDVGRKSLAVLAGNGLNNLFLFADQTVINKFAGATAGGYLGVASNLAYKPADLFVFPLTRTLMVAFSQSSVDKVKLASVYARSLTAALIVALPIYSFLAVFAAPIILLLLGHKFEGSIAPLQAMSLFLAFRVLGNISGYALVPAGKHFQTFYPWVLCIAFTAVSVWFVVNRSGLTLPNLMLLMPIVWCFVGGAIVVYSSIFLLGLRHIPPAREDRSKLWKGSAVFGCSTAVMLLIAMLPIHIYAELLLAIVLGPIIHMALIGTFFAGKPLQYLNKAGPKRLWAEL